MPDTVVCGVSQLTKGQPKLLSFKDRKGRLIGDQVKLPGVDGADPQDPQVEVGWLVNLLQSMSGHLSKPDAGVAIVLTEAPAPRNVTM